VQQSEVKGRVRFADHVPPALRQNQRVSVRIVLDQRDHVLKVERGEFVNAGSYVYRVDGSLANREQVTLGPMSVGEVQILSGVKEGDQIVVSSVSDFNEAPQVRLTD
jgi:HlyD family secretion protein